MREAPRREQHFGLWRGARAPPCSCRRVCNMGEMISMLGQFSPTPDGFLHVGWRAPDWAPYRLAAVENDT
eukprot:2025931-Pyramimonas_sp.AAC.1